MATHALRRSTGRDAATGLVSLIALVALVVAIPVLLVSFIGWPLPRSMPSIDEITTALGDRFVPDRFVVGALACVCWLIWVELVASVVVETFAYVRGEQASDVPLASGMQKVVGRLIGGVALLLAAFAARGEAPDAVKPLGPAQPTPIAQLAAAEIDLTNESLGEADVQAARPTYTVEPRDTLWAIAELTLGDPFRWSEIWDLNANKDMGEGRIFQNPDLIHPGWELELPADALVPGAEQPVEQVSETPPDSEEPVDSGDDGPPTDADDHAGEFGGGSLGFGSGGDSDGATLDSTDSTGDGARVEVLEPLDEPDVDGPNGGVIAGPRVETLDPIQPAGDLAEDSGEVEETAGPVDDSHD